MPKQDTWYLTLLKTPSKQWPKGMVKSIQSLDSALTFGLQQKLPQN